jgi:hypothetical protein
MSCIKILLAQKYNLPGKKTGNNQDELIKEKNALAELEKRSILVKGLTFSQAINFNLSVLLVCQNPPPPFAWH